MKGDFSRDTFDKKKHFSRVLMQQGRVQLDADWNEQTAILLHYIRTLAADLIGPFGGPAGDGYGFEIKANDTTFTIGKGRYYVDGILCENHQEDVTYGNQLDYPNPPELDKDGSPYLVYLDVWEHHITALEDDYIREKALGGADTASRAKVVWQVKIQPCEQLPCENANTIREEDNWIKCIELWQPSHPGCLRARVKQPDKSTDPCLTEPEAKYRGTENNLYRVEIHEVNENSRTFKWSRDNASRVAKVIMWDGDRVTIDNPRGFAAGQWVELLNDGLELRNQPGTLARIRQVEGDTLTLEVEGELNQPAGIDPEKEGWPTKARAWDHAEADIQEESYKNRNRESAIWLSLENGIEIQFLNSDAANAMSYRTGDYWLIPARVATGDVEWPDDPNDAEKRPAAMPPHGIRHHYAPLAILEHSGTTWNLLNDLRCSFRVLPYTCSPSYSYGEEGIGGALLCEETVEK